MLTKGSVVDALSSALNAVEAASPTELPIILAQVATTLARLSTQADPYTPGTQPPSSTPRNPLDTITNIMGDLKENEKYLNKVSNFLSKAGTTNKPEDLINLALAEVVDTNWSYTITIDDSGKTVSLINGSQVINLGKSLLSGNPLDVDTAILGMATKLEKEVFGFSVIETVKELDSISAALLTTTPGDLKLDSTLNTLDVLVGKMGGPRLSPLVKSVLSLVTDLNKKRLESKKILEDAVKEFEQKKEEVLKGVIPEEEPTTTTEPPPTTTEAPVDEMVPPPSKPTEQPVQSSLPLSQEESELFESSVEFLEDISLEDVDDF